MNRRITVALAATAALGLSAVGVGAAAGAAPKNQIRIVGGPTVKPGQFFKDDTHFTPRNLTVKSGATVTLLNRGRAREPHTISFVKKQFLPKKFFSAAFKTLGAAHQFNEQTGDVGVPIVDNGAPTDKMLEVDTLFTDKTAGDSAYIAPGTKRFQFKVTAKKGARLWYFCAIHPWMQGRITVR